ncbi:MAG: amidohydrolase family protein [Vicinamibacterales bacterium]
MTLHDAHCHFLSTRFLSTRFFEALGREKHPERPVGASDIAAALGWEAPGEPDALADRWMAELDQHKVARAALMASAPGDEPSVEAAVARHPHRLVGFFMLNATAPAAPERAQRAFAEQGLRCACLFPAMHRYSLTDERVEKMFEVAAAHRAALFVHCGYLSVEARVKLGLPNLHDLRLGDPLALAATAVRFPSVPVIVPHFGAGFFREALMAAEMCPSIHLDTSSSNSWLKYIPGLTLAEVFRRALTIVGPDRLIFGTDSSFFPRGWRRVIYGAQRTALDELGVEAGVTEKIFGGNFDRIFAPNGSAWSPVR